MSISGKMTVCSGVAGPSGMWFWPFLWSCRRNCSTLPQEATAFLWGEWPTSTSRSPRLMSPLTGNHHKGWFQWNNCMHVHSLQFIYSFSLQAPSVAYMLQPDLSTSIQEQERIKAKVDYCHFKCRGLRIGVDYSCRSDNLNHDSLHSLKGNRQWYYFKQPTGLCISWIENAF